MKADGVSPKDIVAQVSSLLRIAGHQILLVSEPVSFPLRSVMLQCVVIHPPRTEVRVCPVLEDGSPLLLRVGGVD